MAKEDPIHEECESLVKRESKQEGVKGTREDADGRGKEATS